LRTGLEESVTAAGGEEDAGHRLVPGSEISHSWLKKSDYM